MDGINAYSGATGSIDFAQMRKDMFTKADSDGDGKLSVEEFSAAKPADAPADAPESSDIFASLDTDADGFVTETEMAAGNPPPPPPPPSGGQGLMGEDMLSQLLQSIEADETSSTDDEDDEDDSSLISLLEETEEDEGESTSSDILELIQEQLEAYRNSASQYADATNAYNSVQASTLAAQTLAAV